MATNGPTRHEGVLFFLEGTNLADGALRRAPPVMAAMTDRAQTLINPLSIFTAYARPSSEDVNCCAKKMPSGRDLRGTADAGIYLHRELRPRTSSL